jgi:gliding motility-associated-like protein
LNISGTVTNCTCNSADNPAYLTNNGSISLVITGETPLYTFLWSNGSTDKNQFSLSPENYTVTVTDSQGCSNTYHHWITEHDPFDLSCNITPIQPCYNIDNGIVCMIVHGEVPPYTYSWSVAGNTDACITGLGSGNYVVTVTDDNGCWNINSCIVDEPGPVQVNAAIQNNFCNSLDGPPSGSIMLTVVGGVSPYTFTCTDSYGTDWPYPFVNLPSGYYCITINECDTTICYPVNEPLPLSVSLNSYNDENCFYSCDGNINITITGGTPPYFNNNWTCSGTCFCPFPPNAESLVGIGGGTYTLDVHDANFCPYPGFTPVTLSQTINHPPELTVFSTHTDCTGPGCCDGSINLNISGGITPYSINWTYLEDSSFFSTSANNTCLCPGTYQYEVGFTGLDGNPCIMTDIIVINTPTDSIYLDCGFAYCASDLETNIITVHLPAFMMGETVNLIIEGYDITPPGGPILSYTVSDYIVPNPPVYTFSPGTPPWVPFVLNTLQYNVSVTFTAAIPACDDCILENFCELEVYPVPAVTLNDPEIKICCDSLPVFTGVPATIIGAPGTQYVIIYTVTSLADTVTVPFTGTINPPNYSEIIHLPLPPVVNCNAAICPADIWSFTINSISIMFDTIVTCQGSTIIDSCAVYLIPDPVANIDNLSVLPPSPVPGIACEDDTVKIQITFQGVPPFYLLYNDGYNTGPYYSCFDMPGGPAGCNQLTQTGPCVYTGNIYYVPPVIPYPYNFIFSLAEMWDSNMPEANCSGHVSGIQSLIVYPVPDAQFEDAAMSICGFPSTICISVELTGSPPFYITPDIEYPPGTIIPQPVVGPVYQNSYELCIPSPLPVATADCFNVILSNVSDGSPALCNADSTDNITVCLVDQPAIAPGDITVNPVCEDQDTTSVCVNFSGNGPWTIIYTQNSVVYSVTLNCTTMPCCFFVNPSFGQIIITGLKIDDCQDTVLLNIPLIFNTIPLRTASLSIAAGSVNTICKGEAVMLTLNLTGVPDWDVTIEDGLGNPVIYLNDISSSPFSFLVTPTSTTEYYITSVSNDDVIQCPFIISNDALVVVNNNPDAFFCCSDISICPCVSSSVCISFTGTPPFNLLLSDGVNQVSEIFNVHTVDYDLNKIPPYCVAPFPVTTVYNLLMVTDGTGCSTKLSGFTNITVDDGLPECPCYLEIPTSFSPNGDNINDRLSAEYSDNFIYFDFRVFNIWGDCVFRTNDVSFSWDGRRDGTNEILDMQVFYYYIDAICSSNERVFKKGNITLIK